MYEEPRKNHQIRMNKVSSQRSQPTQRNMTPFLSLSARRSAEGVVINNPHYTNNCSIRFLLRRHILLYIWRVIGSGWLACRSPDAFSQTGGILY